MYPLSRCVRDYSLGELGSLEEVYAQIEDTVHVRYGDKIGAFSEKVDSLRFGESRGVGILDSEAHEGFPDLRRWCGGEI